jgi:hypothetical protein
MDILSQFDAYYVGIVITEAEASFEVAVSFHTRKLWLKWRTQAYKYGSTGRMCPYPLRI